MNLEPNPSHDPDGVGAASPRYVEKLRAPWWLWLLAAGFAVSCGIVFVPIGTWAALGGLVAGGALAVVGLVKWNLDIEVADAVLRVGGARLPAALIGEVRALDAAAMRQERGPRLDARAYLELRAWTPQGVKIMLMDPADPTPYWLVSSTDPQRLAESIRAASSTSRSGPAVG